MDVLGRSTGPDDGPTAMIGHYRAQDGSQGRAVACDIDRPHVGLIVGKRGYGKSYTLGVLAEELATTPPVTPIVIDPMGVFDQLATLPSIHHLSTPQIAGNTIPPQGWCDLLGLPPDRPAGAVLWQAVQRGQTLAEMQTALQAIDADPDATRAAHNHLALAASWNVFAPSGFDTGMLESHAGVVLDCAGLSDPAINAISYGVADALYQARVQERIDTLPWLVVDEVHALFDGAAAPALTRIITRGRHPGVSLMAATQRPTALPDVATTQADLLFTHRLTAQSDRDRLEQIAPAYMGGSFETRMPTTPGEVVLVDDTTERVHPVTIRERNTSHGGASPRASALADPSDQSSTTPPASSSSRDSATTGHSQAVTTSSEMPSTGVCIDDRTRSEPQDT